MFSSRHFITFTVFSFSLFFSSILSAQDIECPPVGKVVDVNCDGELFIVALGDSLVYGIGDTANNNKGGWVLRLSQKLKGATIANYGEPGQVTPELLKEIKTAFSKKNGLYEDLIKADVIIVDTGRNDRWIMDPKDSYNNLKKIEKTLKNKIKQVNGFSPHVAVAVLMYPNRGSQGPWVKELNEKFLLKRSPPLLRFDQASKRLLSDDQIHPTPKGYASLAKIAKKYLTRFAKSALIKIQRKALKGIS